VEPNTNATLVLSASSTLFARTLLWVCSLPRAGTAINRKLEGCDEGSGPGGHSLLRLPSYSTNIYEIWVARLDNPSAEVQLDIRFGQPPVISLQPASQSVNQEDKIQLDVLAANVVAPGLPPAIQMPAPTYQWLFNGRAMTGATSNSLTLPSAHLEDAGYYSVAVSNAIGTVISERAQLAVTAHLEVCFQPGVPGPVLRFPATALTACELVVEASSDLLHWQAVYTVTRDANGGPLCQPFEPDLTGVTARFYRGLLHPCAP
jgi:hypothetical protein